MYDIRYFILFLLKFSTKSIGKRILKIGQHLAKMQN